MDRFSDFRKYNKRCKRKLGGTTEGQFLIKSQKNSREGDQ